MIAEFDGITFDYSHEKIDKVKKIIIRYKENKIK
jgi:hypothetical protein